MTTITPLHAAIAAMKAEIQTAVNQSMKRFEERTGITPAGIAINLLDVTTHNDGSTRRMCGEDQPRRILGGGDMTGIIKRLVRDKHFGFIKAPDGTEYFFHSSAVQNAAWDDLQEGQEVDDFTVSKGTKGPRAENVRVGS